MSCELCGFTDKRRYRTNSLAWTRDGTPLATWHVQCPECGWWQVWKQVWDSRVA